MRKLESLHFRSLRLVIRDHKQQVYREWVTASTRRIPPRSWLKFGAAILDLKTWGNNTPWANLYDSMLVNQYSKNRSPGLLFGYDPSKSTIGRAATRNWIGLAIGQIKQEWTNRPLNNDQIRVIQKKTFTPQFHCQWRFTLFKFILFYFVFNKFYFNFILIIIEIVFYSCFFHLGLC